MHAAISPDRSVIGAADHNLRAAFRLAPLDHARHLHR